MAIRNHLISKELILCMHSVGVTPGLAVLSFGRECMNWSMPIFYAL